MRKRDLLSTAVRGITVNRSRSILTTLGIIIGVGAVVLMVSVGNSFQKYILSQIESVGTNTLDIVPVGLERFGGNLESLTEGDFDALARLPSVQNPVPVIIVSQSIEYAREKISPIVFGTRPGLFENLGQKIEKGRLLDDRDEQSAAAVAVLGPESARTLFGDQEPLGKRITLGDRSFTVIGIMKGQGSLLLSDFDKYVYIPLSMARSITGQRYFSYISLRTVGDPAVAQADVEALLRDRHGIDNPEDDPSKDDFVARTAEQVTSIVNSVTLGLTIFLSLVAAISLLVGGIGIMNIMLVSVSERTKEIGLRKAVGAKRKDILLQFLFEAVSLTMTGGFIGMVGGSFLGWVLALIASNFLGKVDYAVSPIAVVLAVGMAVGTGLIFGIYPAKKAANLSPMEAMRFE